MKKVRIYLCLCLCLLCASCTNDPSLKEGDENPHSSQGELVPIEIVLDPTIGYVQEDLSATRMGMDGQTENVPLLSEWVSIKPSSAIGAPNDDSVMVSMELRQDTDTPATGNQVNTRWSLHYLTRFRLIVFTKEGEGNYVYQSVHDYVMGDRNLPVPYLGSTSIKVPSNKQFRVFGYTFDNQDNFFPMGYPLESYTYGETPIDVPNFNQDFAMYDSGDQTPEGASYGLDVKFFHQFSILEVEINTIGFAHPNAYIYFDGTINIGGENMKWTVGSDYNIGVTGDRTLFKVPFEGGNPLMKCMPSPVSGQTLTVHVNKGKISGVPIANLDISAKGLVRLKPGKRHIMTLQFKKKEIGTQLAPERMTLCQNVSEEEKKALSRLRWADGNLKGTGTEKSYEWASGKSEMGVKDFGYYYTYKSSFQGENVTTSDGIDPCTLLKEEYGSGWRTPSMEEMRLLVRCADPRTVDPLAGRWFMAKDCGVYLKGAGYRDSGKGCGTISTSGDYLPGRYATSDNYNGNLWYALDLVNLGISPSYLYTSGFTVRCVKDGDERPAEK